MNKGKKRNKLGRPRKLTAKQLEAGVEAYFASISYVEPVMREEDVILDRDERTGAITYAFDGMGHRLTRLVPVTGPDGKPLTRLVYVQAPGDYGLCDYLKISIDTWQRYGRLGEKAASQSGAQCAPLQAENSEEAHYAEIYARARGRICAYLEQASETKGGAGARFKLERIYGLTEDKHVEVSGSESLEAYLRGLGGTAEY